MEPNEMERYSCRIDFPNDYDGIVDDKDGELVYYEDAMRIITALQAKIDGMIERPTLSVETEGGTWWYPVLNGITMAACDSREGAERIVSQYRQALGMDDPKEGGDK